MQQKKFNGSGDMEQGNSPGCVYTPREHRRVKAEIVGRVDRILNTHVF